MLADCGFRRCWSCGEWVVPLREEEKLICPQCQAELAWLDHQCQQCGARWETLDEDADGPQKCPECGFVPQLDIKGLGDLQPDQLGRQCGLYSWCEGCDALTLNVPGTTYSGLPFGETASLWWPDRKWHPDYPRLWAEHVRRSAQGDIGGYDAIRALDPVEPTLQQLSRWAFACEVCGDEKFWRGGYTCPRCGSYDSYLIEVRNVHHISTPEASGEQWDEVHVCRICGQEYEVDNASF